MLSVSAESRKLRHHKLPVEPGHEEPVAEWANGPTRPPPHKRAGVSSHLNTSPPEDLCKYPSKSTESYDVRLTTIRCI